VRGAGGGLGRHCGQFTPWCRGGSSTGHLILEASNLYLYHNC
jgi:hypothetical protein